MMTIRRFVITTTLGLFSGLFMSVQAQTPPIEVTTDRDRAQFSTPGQAMHVEVFCRSGELVFEQDSVAGQSVQWQMNDRGERVADGVYLATITVTDPSGKRRKRIEQIIVNSETQPNEVLSANAAITRAAVSPINSDASMLPVSFSDNSASPVLSVWNPSIRAATSPGGALKGTARYDIGEAGAPSLLAVGNTFFGQSAGVSNRLGNFNSFFGASSGQANTIGEGNSFFGYQTGRANMDGGQNSFFGARAGQANTMGYSNSFFGFQAGQANSIGRLNSFFGWGAGLSNTSGGSNSFFGVYAGRANTSGELNSSFGYSAGERNTTGSGNAFFGSWAGQSNTTGRDNSFLGFNAGSRNTEGFQNAFFGSSAGHRNVSGRENAFFGSEAGNRNTDGNRNSFFGGYAGAASTRGSGNTFIGYGAGVDNTTGNDNTFIGSNASGPSTFNNTTAVGANATVLQSNSLVLGSISGLNNATADTNVGIGTATPLSNLHVKTGYVQLPFVTTQPPASDCTTATAGRVVVFANASKPAELWICDTSSVAGNQVPGWVIK